METSDNPEISYIDIGAVAKVELRVGTVTSCQEVEESRKLYKLVVDFGPQGISSILAGVRKFLTADELVGKQGVFVYNLEPKKILDLESQGMMLFAEGQDNSLHIVTIDGDVPNGTRLR